MFSAKAFLHALVRNLKHEHGYQLPQIYWKFVLRITLHQYEKLGQINCLIYSSYFSQITGKIL